jgi:hypothetical protein
VHKATASDQISGTIPEATEVIYMEQDDSWFRDSGPAVNTHAQHHILYIITDPCVNQAPLSKQHAMKSAAPCDAFPKAGRGSVLYPAMAKHGCLCTPQFLVRDVPGQPGKQELAGVDWVFNAWGGETGGLYSSWDKDQQASPSAQSMHCCLESDQQFALCIARNSWGCPLGRNRHRHHPTISGLLTLPTMPGCCSEICSDHECTLLLQVASKILDRARARRYKCPHVMEGGSFHVDGEGCEASPVTDSSLSLHSQSLHPHCRMKVKTSVP